MSKNQFTTTNLTNHRVLIEGPKGRSYVADGTQLADVEQETNGLMTYDREVLKVDPVTVRAVHERLRDLVAAARR